MRDYTTEEVIKIIPMSADKKKEILDNWSSYEEERQYLVGRACWKIFHEFRQQVTDFVYNEHMSEVESGKRKLSDDMMDDVEKDVEGIFAEFLAGKQEEHEEISAIRSKLENFIKPDSN